MLRITVHQDSSSWRMQLEGKLAAAWATEAANIWRSASRDGKQIEIDLTGVTLVDDSGLQLLEAMKQSGARFHAKGVEMKALVGEMTGGSPKASCGWVRHLFGMLALVLIGTISVGAQDAPADLVRATGKMEAFYAK